MTKLTQKKILVTGGAGFIGSHLVNRLIREGYSVVVLDNLSTGKRERVNPRGTFYKVDIASPAIFPLFRKEKPNIVVHLAALPRIPLSIVKPVETTKTNILGTVNVFKAALDTKISRVVFASSSSVYGNQKVSPLKETLIPHPLSPYALQKLVGEQFAKLFLMFYNFPIISLRYFNVYGPGIDFTSSYSLVIGKFLVQNAQKKPLTIFGDGKQTRGFCYIDDVIEGTIRAMRSPGLGGGEVINIGSDTSYSINELANLIGGRAGKVVHLPPRSGDIRHTRADMNLARTLLQWEPRVSFAEGVQRTKEWFELARVKK
ncbi:MAG: NAD-dependent epimerase/dehydratase family protein [Patescibacteria group bacterium]